MARKTIVDDKGILSAIQEMGTQVEQNVIETVSEKVTSGVNEGIKRANKKLKDTQIKLEKATAVLEKVVVETDDESVRKEVESAIQKSVQHKSNKTKVKVKIEAEPEVTLPKDFSIINKGKSKYASRLAEQIKAAYQTNKKDNTDGSNQRLVAYYSAAKEKERLIADPKKFNLEKQFEFSKDEFKEIQNIYDELITKNEKLRKVAELAAEAMREQVKIELSPTVVNQKPVLSGNQTEISLPATTNVESDNIRDTANAYDLLYEKVKNILEVTQKFELSGSSGQETFSNASQLVNGLYDSVENIGLTTGDQTAIVELIRKNSQNINDASIKEVVDAILAFRNENEEVMRQIDQLVSSIDFELTRVQKASIDSMVSTLKNHNKYSAMTKQDFVTELQENIDLWREQKKQLDNIDNQTNLSSPDTTTPFAKDADVVEDAAKEIDEANEKIEASNEEVEKSEEELGQATIESRQKSSDAAKKDADEKIAQNERVIASNKEVVQSEQNSHVDVSVNTSANPLNTKSSTTGINNESSAADNVARSMDKAAESKKKFAKANKNVEESAKASKEAMDAEADAADNGVTKAFRNLIQTEKTFQQLTAKKELLGSLSPTEANNLEQLTAARKRDNEVIQQANELTDKQIKLRDEYNLKVKDVEGGTSAFQDTLVSGKLSSYDTFYNRIDANKRNLTQVVEYKNKLDELKTTIKELKSYSGEDGKLNITSDEDIAKIAQTISAIETLEKEIRLMQNNVKYQGADTEEALDKMAKISQTLEKNTKMPKALREMFEALRRDYQIAIDTGASQKRLEELNVELARLNANLQASGKTGNSFFNLVGKKINGMAAQFFATYVSLQDLIRYMQQAYQYVADIDKQMIELEKVSDMSANRLEQSFEHAAIAAKDLGATISDVLSATADWSRLGYDADAAEELAEVAILYKNVGDGIDISTANESLISTLQGFQMDASEAIDIVDQFNEVANNYAIDSAGIGEALKRSASSFNAANTSIEKSIALITATDEVLQNSESTGTLWKTMSARIRGASTELEELGEETDEYTQTTSKLRDLIQGLTGFDIMLDEDTFKDIYDIILGIGQEWDKLTDVERASLGEALAGKRNANGLYAVLDNLDTLQEVYKTAQNASGSALREQEKWEQGLEARTNKLKASLEELSTTLLDSDFLGGAIDAGRVFIEILTKIVDTLGVIPSLLTGIGAGIGIKSAISGGGRVKKFTLRVYEYATGEFSSDVYELCVA